MERRSPVRRVARAQHSNMEGRCRICPAAQVLDADTVVKVASGEGPLASNWSFRPTLVFVVAVVASIGSVSEYGWGGLPGALFMFGGVLFITMRGASRLTVYSDRIALRLGPFGIVSREVPRETALLWTVRFLSYEGLTIKREDRHVLWPFVSAHIGDRWPEKELRAAGYRYQN